MTDQDQQKNPTPDTAPDPKWAALVQDRLVPMPRRQLRARDVLHQAAVGEGYILVRDLNTPVDIGFAPDAMVDLAGGNVFRVVPDCAADEIGAHGADPKLAFVVDDAWEITTNPNQTAGSLRGLFNIGEEFELVRDYESPDDEPVEETTEIHFADGPVFITQPRSVTIKVNHKPVVLTRRRVTGLQIKQAAIEQGVAIKIDFLLFKVDGDRQVLIGDADKIVAQDCDDFRCVAPDDNS